MVRPRRPGTSGSGSTRVRPGAKPNAAPPVGERVERLPIAHFLSSPHNPRRKFSRIEELAESMREYGLLQPIVVRRKGEHYEVLAGHRRLAAARHLEWSDVPAIVREEGEDRAYLLTLVENLQRQDLSPREEADALEVLVRDRGWTTRQVAEAVKRSQAYVSKRLRVFEDPILAPAVLSNQLSVSAAEELLTVPERDRYNLLNQAMEGGWDRQAVRAAAQAQLGPNRSGTSRPPGLSRHVHQFRVLLRDVQPHDLTEVDRRELRLLFSELSLLARAPKERRRRVFPPLNAS